MQASNLGVAINTVLLFPKLITRLSIEILNKSTFLTSKL